jgi:hypothetical protein
MREARMPWPAIDYDQLTGLAGLKQLGGDGIPSVSPTRCHRPRCSPAATTAGKYLGPKKVMGDLEKIFAGGVACAARTGAITVIPSGFVSIFRDKVAPKPVEITRVDFTSGASHEVEIEMQIVKRYKAQAEYLLGLDQMAQIAASKIAACGDTRSPLRSGFLQGELRVLQVERAFRR